MAHLLPSRFPAVFLLSVLLLLSGCCANNVCNCEDAQADAVKLRFTARFLDTDLDTVVIKRYPKKFTSNTIPETVTLIRTSAQARDSILLNNNTPFTQSGTTKLNSYRYVVQYYKQQPGQKSLPTDVLVLDSVQLQGSLDGNGCCTCYTNSKKVVFAKENRKNLVTLDSAFVNDLTRNPVLYITR